MTKREDDIDAVGHNLVLLLRRSRGITVRAAKAVHPELEGEAYSLLVRIHDLGSVTASDLAAYFGVGKPTMSRQIGQLEHLRLVQRKADEHDGRSFAITLTKLGEKRLANVRSSNRANFRSNLREWSNAELTQLADSLEKLNETSLWE